MKIKKLHFPMIRAVLHVPVHNGHPSMCPVATKIVNINLVLARAGAQIYVRMPDTEAYLRVCEAPVGIEGEGLVVLHMSPVHADIFGLQIGHGEKVKGWSISGDLQPLKGHHLEQHKGAH